MFAFAVGVRAYSIYVFELMFDRGGLSVEITEDGVMTLGLNFTLIIVTIYPC